jgi:hypothetical protein
VCREVVAITQQMGRVGYTYLPRKANSVLLGS